MKVVLNLDDPLKGVEYMAKADNKVYVFRLVEIMKDKQDQAETQENFPDFGFLSHCPDASEEEITQAKKAAFKGLAQ